MIEAGPVHFANVCYHTLMFGLESEQLDTGACTKQQNLNYLSKAGAFASKPRDSFTRWDPTFVEKERKHKKGRTVNGFIFDARGS